MNGAPTVTTTTSSTNSGGDDDAQKELSSSAESSTFQTPSTSSAASVAVPLTTAELEERISDIDGRIKKREKKCLPLYHQIALSFVDLHDTPNRMVKKKVIKRVVEWETSREFFYWRLHRRLLECSIVKRIMAVDSALEWRRALDLLRKCIMRSCGGSESSCDAIVDCDRKFVAWCFESERQIEELVATTRADVVRRTVAELVRDHPSGSVAGLLEVFDGLAPEQAAALREKIASR